MSVLNKIYIKRNAADEALFDLELDYGVLSSNGQKFTFVGTRFAEGVFVRPGMEIDFSRTAGAVDRIYFENGFADYAFQLDPTAGLLTVTRGTGSAAETVIVSVASTSASSDMLIFNGGGISTLAVKNALLNAGYVPGASGISLPASAVVLDGNLTSQAPVSPVLQEQMVPTVSADVYMGLGGQIKTQGPAVSLKIIGSRGVDVVYVTDGSQVDATRLSGGVDQVYLRGSYADYTKALTSSDALLTLTREVTVDGVLVTEKVVVSAQGTATTSDLLVFADGSVMAYGVKTALLGSAPGAALQDLVTYNGDLRTPGVTMVADVAFRGYEGGVIAEGDGITYLNAGDIVSVAVTMSEDVVVDTTGGTPRIRLNIMGVPDGTAIYADYDAALSAADGNAKTLVFTYTVDTGLTDLGDISIPSNALELNHGHIQDLAGHSIVLTHAFVASDASIRVDTQVQARITEMLNDTGSVSNDRLTKDGKITLADLEPGARWQFSVDGGESWSDGAGDSFTLGNGRFLADQVQIQQVDRAGNVSEVTKLAAIEVDTTAAELAGMVLSYEGGVTDEGSGVTSLNAGAKVIVTVTMSEDVVVDTTDGTPRLRLNILGVPEGTAIYADYDATLSAADDNGKTLVFASTIEAALDDVTAISIPPDALDLNRGRIEDLAGNTDTVGASTQSFLIAETSDAVVNGYIQTGESVDILVTMDDAVYVEGLPRLALDVAGAVGYADYVSGSGTAELLFRYTALNPIDLDAIGVLADALAVQVNGGIADWFGNSSAQTNEIVVAEHAWSTQTGWGVVDALAAINALTDQCLSDVSAGTTPWWFGVSNINDAWSYGYTGEGITVAVLDTGINLQNWDFTTGSVRSDSRHFYIDSTTDKVVSDTYINDDNGHGTFVASEIVAASNGYRLTGGSYDSSLLVLKVMPASGSLSNLAPIIEAIYYAVDHGAKIINMSLGGLSGDQSYVEALQYASDHNVLVVMSSGNAAGDVPLYPAWYAQDFDNCLSVGGVACDSAGVLTQYTAANDAGLSGSYGYLNAGAVDVDGYYIGTNPTDIYRGTGTSMAAPIVAAAAALVWSADPSATAADVARVLYQTSHAFG